MSAQQPGAHIAIRDSEGTSVARTLDCVSIIGESPAHIDRRLADGTLHGQIDGLLLIQRAGDYQFDVQAKGQFRVKINDSVVLESEKDVAWIESKPVRLEPGLIPLQVEYQSHAAPVAKDSVSFRLFWSGPEFEMSEPVGGRYLFHAPTDHAQKTIDGNETESDQLRIESASDLIQSYHCNACHNIDNRPPLAAPSLDHLTTSTINGPWLIDWIVGKPATNRHCPTYAFDNQQAADVASYLMPTTKAQPSERPSKRHGEVDKGEILFASIGCLACHSVQTVDDGLLGRSGEFGGGDLSLVATKRPPVFFERWLESPERINANHRMPVFELSSDERADLAAYLATQGAPAKRLTENPVSKATEGNRASGARLASIANCSACHELPPPPRQATTAGTAVPQKAASQKLIPIESWTSPCPAPDAASNLSEHQPQFHLPAQQRDQIRRYVEALKSRTKSSTKSTRHSMKSPSELLAENNCLACHSRGLDLADGLSDAAATAVERHTELAGQYAALIPPSLNQVGDKLTNDGLRSAIARKTKPLRPWLRIRMPRFGLTKFEVHQLVEYFTNHDRLPLKASPAPALDITKPIGNHTRGRLVGPDGFNCASCHSLGQYQPADAPINTRGPNLTAVVGRVRQEWFARWVRNPIRIVPNVEMPSISIPVKGVLRDDLDLQIAAVWNAIRDPDFTVPPVRPFRVLRQNGSAPSATGSPNERSIVLTDVLKVQHQGANLDTYLKPFAIGLPCRHNVLFDLGSGRLVGWWLGDLAGQINNGKRWHWQANIRNVLANETARTESKTLAPRHSDIVLVRGGKPINPMLLGQFVTRADSWRHVGPGVELDYRLRYETNDGETLVHVRRRFRSAKAPTNGFIQTIECSASTNETVHLIVAKTNQQPTISTDKQQLTLSADSRVRIQPNGNDLSRPEFSSGSTIELQLRKDKPVAVQLAYTTDLRADYFASSTKSFNESPIEPQTINVVPGFTGTILPINEPFMPTGFAWNSDGEMLVSSLDGRVWQVADTNGNGLPNRAHLYSDELSTPYGLAAGNGYIDVVDKTALLRLRDTNGDGHADETTTLAAGWGHTDDYHDWVVGLESDSSGNYYVAIPCQQDDRSEAAAYLRGKVLRLSPRVSSPENPEQFSIHKLSGGHRFPHGLARSRAGDLFVTDNQGNFNPFNELNHIVKDRRFGFINQSERKPNFKPRLTPPAINIPHPWTRSVNGICFLDSNRTPDNKSTKTFGPFEGHIVGCEYDTRRLVRMSLQRVGNEYQGAVYPFSYTPSRGNSSGDRAAIPGPIVCKVGPDGDLYVGSLRESGWGGGKNTGEIVRLSPDVSKIPPGIAEIRATKRGFEIEFTKAVDPRRAADSSNYHVMSYTRVSTPKYGGDDVDRREEKVATVTLDSDRLVRMRLQKERKLGYVYEIRIEPLVESGEFHPSTGYYTLNRVP